MDRIAETRKWLAVVVQLWKQHVQLNWSDGMRTYRAKVGQGGRITAPVEVREYLRLKPGNKVEYLVDEDRIILRRAELTLEDVFRLVKPLIPTTDMDIEEVIRLAKEDYFVEKYGLKDEEDR